MCQKQCISLRSTLKRGMSKDSDLGFSFIYYENEQKEELYVFQSRKIYYLHIFLIKQKPFKTPFYTTFGSIIFFCVSNRYISWGVFWP